MNLKNKQSKQNRDRIMDMKSVFIVARLEGGVGEWVIGEGMKKYK